MAAPKRVQFALASGSTSAVAVTGVGFTPSAVVFLGAVKTAAGTGIAAGIGFGFMCADGTQGAIAAATRDHVSGTSFTHRNRVSATKCFMLIDTAVNGVDGEIGFTSMDSDGFTVTPSDAFTGNWLVDALCFPPGWSAKVISAAVTAATGNTQAFTGAGFTPDIVIGLGTLPRTALATDGLSGGIGIGMMTASNQVCSATARNSGSATDWYTILRTDRFFSYPRTDSSTERINLNRSSLDSDGFTVTVTRSAGSEQPYLVALCLKAPASVGFTVGSFAAQTSTGNFAAVTGLAYAPAGLLLWSGFSATSSQTSATGTRTRYVIGMATASNNRATVGLDEHNNAGVGSAQTTLATDKCFYPQILTAQDTPSDGGSQDFVSFDSGGFTLNQVVAAGAANLELYLSIGQAASSTTMPVFASNQRRMRN